MIKSTLLYKIVWVFLCKTSIGSFSQIRIGKSVVESFKMGEIIVYDPSTQKLI